ncbi:formin-binding protein 4-like [Tigriopus californicus]|uniref:formin-binding protein 4-like n=1 Tax=Tigriopus californicus TaxID=6832 RepID=UPI0027DA008D|nr:formin-binding protein 4-like [Tigriopus californicus]
MAMNGLVSYESASEEDEPTHPDITPTPTPTPTEPVWKECVDATSGHSYYWHTQTNQVSWIQPAAFIPKVKKAVVTAQAAGHSSLKAVPPTVPSSTHQPVLASKGRTGSSGSRAKKGGKEAVVFGPALPAEVIAREKIKKFEDQLAASIIQDIERELPPDWHNHMAKALHPRPFRWNKKEPCLPEWKALTEQKASNSVSLISSSYGDDSEEDADADDDDDEQAQDGPAQAIPVPTKDQRNKAGQKRKMSIRMKTTPSKASRTQLKPVLEVFQHATSSESEAEEGEQAENSPQKPDEKSRKKEIKRDEHGRKIYETGTGTSYKKSIDDVAEGLCDKLEALEVASITISPLKLLAVRVETLFQAWQSGALTPGYMQKLLGELSRQMLNIEATELVPPGWKTIWNSSARKYSYENLITREVQWHPPSDTTEAPTEDCSDDVPENTTINTTTQNHAQPSSPRPLDPTPIAPPLPPSEPTPPPLPPIVPPPPPPPPAEEVVEVHIANDQGMADMEMSDEDDADPVDERPIEGGPGREVSFTDELSTFYASLGGSSSLTHETAPTPPSHSPTPPSRVESPLSNEGTHSPTPNVGAGATAKEERKVKKKRTLASGLSLKKKGVDNLVAKWQNIQNEVKRSQ